ncbi:helix-turn-helix domain-containing protein [Modestobacter sp. VKM Ac-2985]|uniref:helix-turn-helix domain-containing protein n=1 Tax=Modestobacter sp. VKM Ac-2985 TaxID=3004139 RepID=UPI0022ABA73E|nr:helix-turn-helix transcriptional regulator [Modestobacter sp. VKM Ac-2985]MCZ2839624.1 helix-turn-helix transcriptional regulator [Modestobacter sp. VKM Ac-2985]
MAAPLSDPGAAPGLGALLRRFRDRCTFAPDDAVAARRAPGLRREELALLAGVSVDYLVQLEQGRASRPSASVVAALSRALRLDADESALLHRAAGLAPIVGPVVRVVPAGVERMVARLQQWPVAVYSADWWLLRWNTAWSALLGDPAPVGARERNVVWFEMTQPNPGVWIDPSEDENYRDAIVGDLRVALVEHPHDPELVDLVATLRQTSPEFVERWDAARPARFRGMRKHVQHPDVGLLVLDGDVLQAPGSDVRLVVYSPAPGTRDAHRLTQLSLRGTGTPSPGSPLTVP